MREGRAVHFRSVDGCTIQQQQKMLNSCSMTAMPRPVSGPFVAGMIISLDVHSLNGIRLNHCHMDLTIFCEHKETRPKVVHRKRFGLTVAWQWIYSLGFCGPQIGPHFKPHGRNWDRQLRKHTHTHYTKEKCSPTFKGHSLMLTSATSTNRLMPHTHKPEGRALPSFHQKQALEGRRWYPYNDALV